MSNEVKKLPSIKELYADSAMTVKENKLNLLLNQPPKQEWIGYHPIAKIEVKDPATGRIKKEPIPYIPISRLEWLMTRLFIKWRREIKNVVLIANSVAVTMRVWYKDPITGEWEWTEGVGAAPLQTDKDAGATDFNRIKSNAVQIGAPAAAAYAFKNAVASLGKLFGKDLVRSDEISYNVLMNDIDAMSIPVMKAKISSLLDANQDNEEKASIIDMITSKEASGEATAEFYANIINTLENGR